MGFNITDAEPVSVEGQDQTKNVTLKKLNEEDENTIFNVIILDKHKEDINE